VPIVNFTFYKFAWKAGGGLMACSADGQECTQNVAVPSGTITPQDCYCQEYDPNDWQTCLSESCYSNPWSIKSILFSGKITVDNFRCSSDDSSTTSSSTSSPSPPKACLTDTNDQNNNVANTDDLDEYFEYTTGVPSEWSSTDTVWFVEADPEEGNEAETLRLEPPMLLNLKVPEDEEIQSISGIHYAGKSIVLQFADGIDIYNSAGFPMWCLNRETGNSKEPFVDDYGWTSCVNYTAMDEAMNAQYASSSGGYETSDSTTNQDNGNGNHNEPFDWSEWQYELFPDILPELHWEGTDGLNRKWGLKPAEKTLIYVEIGEGNCTQDFENPVALEQDEQSVVTYLQEGGETMRTGLTDLIAWYRENKDDADFLRVHTGKLVGQAAQLAVEAAGGESGSG